MNANSEIERCIDICLERYRRCTQTAMGHCLEAGGEHVAPAHFRLIMGCAGACRATAHAMLIGVENQVFLCSACSMACDDCAPGCEGMEGMAECSRTFRECAEVCDKMSAQMTVTFEKSYARHASIGGS